MKLKNYFFLLTFLCLNNAIAQNNTLTSATQKTNAVEQATYLNFGSQNDYVRIPGISINNSSLTIEFYARIYNPYQAGYILSQGVEAQNQQLQIGFRSSGEFHFSFYGNDMFIPSYNRDSNWHHWACVYDISSGLRSVYQDGNLVGQSGTSPYVGTGDLLLGLRTLYNNTGYYGDLEDLRIWNVVRTSAEIISNKECELVGNETGLLAYYKFNQGESRGYNRGIASLLDETANAHNGTFHSFHMSGSQSNFVAGSPVSSCTVLSTSNINLTSELQLSPNPTTGIVNVNISNLTNVSVLVYNLNGKEVFNTVLSKGENSVDISHFQSGMYSFKITSAEGIVVKKVLKK
ncbi:hypothetical protein FHR24_001973 [Wenyingzhuangia heitensis]|uniref:LamG-like jellyroll fold domain-containing protein n=1 Tax=Wenyingzhuangia heitensis TaxID=1487859 RepID=A0ABX0UCG7_9FLAO|nr:LamG-like jellyroll fold domain-containing protein [Wenyingzhuangia heitensis]NIJ45505.1 hypothetical protein [Wenyingzhuangia heitensis]